MRKILISAFLLFFLFPSFVFANTTIYFPSFEKDLEKNKITKYYSLPNLSIQKVEDTKSYSISDHLSSTKVITNSQSSQYLSYYPYGSFYIKPQNSNITNLYTSQKLDPITLLYYYHARYYNPNTAHFISADYAKSFNRYSYVQNNPINNTDPTGNMVDEGGGLGGNYDPLDTKGSSPWSDIWKNFSTPLIQDWKFLTSWQGNIPERTIAAADLLSLGSLRLSTFAINDYVAINTLANQQGLSWSHPLRIKAAVNAGVSVTSFSSSIVGWGTVLKAAEKAIIGFRLEMGMSKLKRLPLNPETYDVVHFTSLENAREIVKHGLWNVEGRDTLFPIAGNEEFIRSIMGAGGRNHPVFFRVPREIVGLPNPELGGQAGLAIYNRPHLSSLTPKQMQLYRQFSQLPVRFDPATRKPILTASQAGVNPVFIPPQYIIR